MWYRFTKTNWVWDIPVRAKKPYAYVKADTEYQAIEKLNTSEGVTRTYDRRGIDNIDEVYTVPMEHIDLVVINNKGKTNE